MSLVEGGEVAPTPCAQFVASPGGAHHWCEQCGWRRDHHADCPPATAERYRERGAR